MFLDLLSVMTALHGFETDQGARIRRHRLAAGLTIPDLANAVGTSAGAVSHWETGRHTPRRERQLAIAKAIGVSWSELFGMDS